MRWFFIFAALLIWGAFLLLGRARRGFVKGLEALKEAALEVLRQTDGRIHAELYGGPLVAGARPLSRAVCEQSRAELAGHVRHTAFAAQKAIEVALDPLWPHRTEGQRTVMGNEIAGALAPLLGRAYYSGFVLGQVFTREGWWGPWQGGLALPPGHTRQQFEEKRQHLTSYHPWLPPLAREVFLPGVFVAEEEKLIGLLLEEDTPPQQRPALSQAIRGCLDEGLWEALAKGVFHGISVQQNAPSSPAALLPGANGHGGDEAQDA